MKCPLASARPPSNCNRAERSNFNSFLAGQGAGSEFDPAANTMGQKMPGALVHETTRFDNSPSPTHIAHDDEPRSIQDIGTDQDMPSRISHEVDKRRGLQRTWLERRSRTQARNRLRARHASPISTTANPIPGVAGTHHPRTHLLRWDFFFLIPSTTQLLQ